MSQRVTLSKTKRPTVAALEEILFEPIRVLDHGYIRVIDYMGEDAAIVQAARVSYGRGTRKLSEDRALIGYLMRHRHTTPFEMAEIKFHVRLPIFVARQWIRHRTANVNEYSARYSVLDNEFYIPSFEHLAAQSKSNKQGRDEVLDNTEAAAILEILRSDAQRNYEHYLWMLNEPDDHGSDPTRSGLARELARINLTLNTYTQWYWKIDLHNLLNFLQVRADKHAQYEIRAYADELLKIVKRWVPLTFVAFMEHRFEAVTLSKTAVDLISRMLAGERVDVENSGLTSREWKELSGTFNLLQGNVKSTGTK